jgi:hypothetical protein
MIITHLVVLEMSDVQGHCAHKNRKNTIAQPLVAEINEAQTR